MKKLLLVICFILFASSPVWSMSLVCDPVTGAASYEVEESIGGGTALLPGDGTIRPDGAVELLNLNGYPAGLYVWRARAISAEGWPSEWSDPYGAGKPGVPGNPRLAE